MEEDYYEPDLSLEGNGLSDIGGPLPIPYDEEPIEEKYYTVTLADGTELKNLRLSGNNFVSDFPILKDCFNYNLSPVKISDGTIIEVHNNMELNAFQMINDKYYFVLLDLTEQELRERKIDADIMYLSMMTGAELD